MIKIINIPLIIFFFKVQNVKYFDPLRGEKRGGVSIENTRRCQLSYNALSNYFDQE